MHSSIESRRYPGIVTQVINSRKLSVRLDLGYCVEINLDIRLARLVENPVDDETSRHLLDDLILMHDNRIIIETKTARSEEWCEVYLARRNINLSDWLKERNL